MKPLDRFPASSFSKGPPSMLPATTQNVWELSTERDWLKALTMLERLPSRATFSAEFDQQLFFIALRGTTKYGLFTAVEAIHQNALGHPFHPQPSELRGQCDKAMAPHEDQRARAVRNERIAKEQAECRPVQKTPEQIARARRLLAGFHAQYEKPEAKIISNLDPALVAQLPDNPAARQRMGLKE